MSNKHIKRDSASLLIREMQNKARGKCHFTPVRLAKSKGEDGRKCWWRCRAQGTLIRCWWRRNGTATLEDNLTASRNDAHTLVTQRLGFWDKSRELLAHCNLVILVKNLKQPQCLSADEMHKQIVDRAVKIYTAVKMTRDSLWIISGGDGE